MTIYALSTGPGVSGVAIIRISGKIDTLRMDFTITIPDHYVKGGL